MANDYAYMITQCDVPPERRAALETYRGKRRLWLSWINEDEQHAIWQVLSSMVWTDASFKLLSYFAEGDQSSALGQHVADAQRLGTFRPSRVRQAGINAVAVVRNHSSRLSTLRTGNRRRREANLQIENDVISPVA